MMFKAYVIGGAVVALLLAFAAHDAKVKKQAVATERARVEKEVSKTNDRAKAARKSIASVDPSRVLDKWFRD